MDRLICGDVGFGKTEVALRAAFDRRHQRQAGGRRRADHVAGAPAFQDLHRALPRLPGQRRRRPSRLVPTRELTATKAGLADGSVDIVIGTHALLGKGIKFKDLGLRGRRRGAAFRRHAQGEAQDAARRSACADADRDADPAHLATGADRRARSVDHRLAAGRPPGGAHLRVAVRSGHRARGAAAREISRRPGLLCLPAHRGSGRRQGLPRQERAGGARRRRARPDAADRARRHHVGLLRRQIRRAAVDHDHRIRPRYSDRQYADRASRRHVRPVAALSVARPGRALEAARLCAVHAAGATSRSRRRPSGG